MNPNLSLQKMYTPGKRDTASKARCMDRSQVHESYCYNRAFGRKRHAHQRLISTKRSRMPSGCCAMQTADTPTMSITNCTAQLLHVGTVVWRTQPIFKPLRMLDFRTPVCYEVFRVMARIRKHLATIPTSSRFFCEQRCRGSI